MASSGNKSVHYSCGKLKPDVNKSRPMRRYHSEQTLSSRKHQSSSQEYPGQFSQQRTNSTRSMNRRSNLEVGSQNETTPNHTNSNQNYSVLESPGSVFSSPREESSNSSRFMFNGNFAHPEADASCYTSRDTSALSSNNRNYEEAEKRFCRAVRQNAEEVAGETQDPIELDHSIDKVRLELSSEQGMPMPSTFGKRRSLVNEDGARAPRGNVKIEDIFQLAEANATEEAKRCVKNPSSSQRYIWEHGNRVLVTGQAGIGKSTLTRQVVQKILDKEMLPSARYVFYIKCRYIDFEEKLDLFDFLQKYSVSEDIEFDWSEKKHVMKMIDKMNEVVLLFDGMDEAHTEDLSISGAPKCLPKDVVKSSVIVRSIMSGKLLPRAKVLVTCRSLQAYRFSPEYRPGAVVQIIGLNTKSQKKLGKQICGEKNFSATYNIIHKDEDLESACYVTVFCMILYAVLHQASKGRRSALPLNTITRVLVYLLDKYLRSAHMRDVAVDELRKIAELARIGFMRWKPVFTQDIINEIGITREALQAFMVTYLDSDTKLRYRIFEGQQRCSFSHMIWLEFFTAIDLMFFASSEVFDECTNMFNEKYNRWEVVAKFMYGLTNKETVEFIQRHFLPRHFNSEWGQRKSFLRTSAECRIQRQVQDPLMLMQVCNWIQEADDYSFSSKVASRLPQTFKIAGNSDDLMTLFNHDVQSIVRILYAALDFSEENPVKNINFENVVFTGDSFRHFASHMSRIRGTVQEVRLINCDLGNSAGNQVIRFMHKTERLHIAYCCITSAEIGLMKQEYVKLVSPRPEVWIFPEGLSPVDLGEDFRQQRAELVRRSAPVQHGE